MNLLLSMPGVSELPNLLTFLHESFKESVLISLFYRFDSLFYSFLLAIALSSIFYLGAKKRQLIPEGFQNFLEWLVETFRDFIVGVLGPDGEKYVPFLGTLFFYILSMNLLGLVPLMKSP